MLSEAEHRLMTSHLQCPQKQDVHLNAKSVVVDHLELRALGNLANLQLAAILLQDLLVMVLPELFRCVLPSHALEDLSTAGMLVEEVCGGCGLATIIMAIIMAHVKVRMAPSAICALGYC